MYTAHVWKWSFVALGEDEMMKKCLISAWKFPLQDGFFPRPKWGEVVLDGRCFSHCSDIKNATTQTSIVTEH